LSFKAYDGTSLCARFYPAGTDSANILYFHGNGEIAQDYDSLASQFTSRQISLMVADYRGYGLSQGQPTVFSLLTDAHAFLNGARHFLEQEGHTGPLVVMGRSLGSAPALEIAANVPESIQGLVIESGFAHSLDLLERIGAPVAMLGIKQDPVGNLKKMASVTLPTLVIHAEFDHIIPFTHGQALFDACPSQRKLFYEVPGANHNDIFFVNMADYMNTLQSFLQEK
jgi:fermentation-respiration switch protein FrsA (DUF1100 family)